MIDSDNNDAYCAESTDSSIKETTEPGLPDSLVTAYILYIPDFVTVHVHGDMTEEDIFAANDLFLTKNWLTSGLNEEIDSHYPKNEDICAETGKRSMESFKEDCLQLFPVNHIFASSRQICQAAKKLCDVWGISSTSLGKKIVCYYGKAPTQNHPQKVTLGMTRVCVPSLKSQECSFEIQFNWG
jgi:hypothetical protein